MSKFIDTKDGLVNLDHVIYVTWQGGKPVYWTSDERSFRGESSISCAESLNEIIVPAAAGYYTTLDWKEAKDISDLSIVPVVAWKINGDTVSPVALDDCDYWGAAVIAPDGTVTSSGSDGLGTWPNLEDWFKKGRHSL